MGFPEWSDDVDTFCCDVVTLAMLWRMSEGRVTAGKTQLQLEAWHFQPHLLNSRCPRRGLIDV